MEKVNADIDGLEENAKKQDCFECRAIVGGCSLSELNDEKEKIGSEKTYKITRWHAEYIF